MERIKAGRISGPGVGFGWLARWIVLLAMAWMVVAVASWWRTRAPFPIRVNCGGPPLGTSGGGDYWAADDGYCESGDKAAGPDKISLKAHPLAGPAALYETVRRGKLDFVFKKIPMGVYEVRLHFADPAPRGVIRSKDYWINGMKVISKLNLKEILNRRREPHVVQVWVEVGSNGRLELRGRGNGARDAVLSGIEVLRAPAGAIPTRDAGIVEATPNDLADRLREFAGGAVRLAWVRLEDDQDIYAHGPTGTLWGLDSEDGTGERRLLAEPGSYARPLINADGSQVVFTDAVTRSVRAVNWDGTGLRTLCDGYAGDIWRDPDTGVDWVYLRENWKETESAVVRVRLDDPETRETVWDSTAVGHQFGVWLQISGDGRLMAETLPWPVCALADLESGDYQPMGSGCWPGVAPDASGRSFHFLGTHKTISFRDEPGGKAREIRLDTVPKWPGRKVYHPRWSNHPRFFTATAPQSMPETELYLGRFDETFSKVEAWFRVTYNDAADFWGAAVLRMPDSGGVKKGAAEAGNRLRAPSPDSGPRPLLNWENAQGKNEIMDETGRRLGGAVADLRGAARWNRWHGADLRGGELWLATPAVSKALERCRAEAACTVSVTLRADDLAGSGTVLTLGRDTSTGKAGGWLEMIQRADCWLARWPGGHEIILGKVKSGAWQRITLRVRDGELSGWLDGKESGSAEIDAAELFRSGRQAALTLGPWRGQADGVAVYSAGLSDDAISRDGAARVKAAGERAEGRLIVVEAELIEETEPAEPGSILPYQRSLSEHVFAVRRVERGELEEKRSVVLQWGVLNGEAQARKWEPGEVGILRLQPVEDRPELAGEHRQSDHLEFDLPVFLDVTN
jgi:hypothetical protein